jgi:hypothetical protein
MARKHRPSDSIHPEIKEIVDILADRIISRGCSWRNLLCYIRYRITYKAFKHFSGSRSKTRRCLGMAEKTLRYHLYESNFGSLNREMLNG